ncbi:MAG: imidazole glycerol phosphate synthase subunit HisH [Bacteroidia bacterium]|nr:MAG: imidazole glycerol phosphate synthase subunit HisH [Bacteroidia bacterium]
MKIGLIAYRGGNVRSIRSALEALGAEVVYSADPFALSVCSGLVFPGVGAALPAVEDLQARGLWDWLPRWEKPFLGICLGMQLMGRYLEEGNVPGLGIFPFEVIAFQQAPRTLHIGWNLVSPSQPDPLWEGLKPPFYAYFVHGYRASVGPYSLAETTYGETFSAAVRKALFWGVQFHPEKSGRVGLMILANFLRLCASYQA